LHTTPVDEAAGAVEVEVLLREAEPAAAFTKSDAKKGNATIFIVAM